MLIQYEAPDILIFSPPCNEKKLKEFILNSNKPSFHSLRKIWYRVWTGVSPIHISPDVGLSIPPAILSMVDFPLPDLPIMATNSPGMFRHDHRRIPQRVFLELREGLKQSLCSHYGYFMQ